MPRFKLMAEWSGDEYSLINKKVEHEFEEESLDDVINCLADFIKGCGFVIEGLAEVDPE